MRIHIPVADLSPEIQELYTQERLGYFGIDYQYNNIIAGERKESIHLDEKWKEIEVFNFTKYLKMDNRFNNYEIHLTPQEIIIEITV